MSCRIIKPDSADQQFDLKNVSVFLAGSIDNGKASLWSHIVQDALADFDVTIFNPRRDTWQSDLEARAHNADFREQVNWELDRLSYSGQWPFGSDIAFFYFEPGSVSPITLQELGYVIGSMRRVGAGDNYRFSRPSPIVVCPDGFWRKGNVEIMCERNSIAVINDLDTGITALKIAIEIRMSDKAKDA